MAQQVIQAGYRYLAEKILKKMEKVAPNASFSTEILDNFKRDLEKILETGDIRSIGKPENLHLASCLFEDCIDDRLKPKDKNSCANIPLYFLSEHYNVTPPEMKKMLNFNRIILSEQQSGIEIQEDGGKRAKWLFVFHDQGRPALSILLNLKSMYHGLQPEQDQRADIMNEIYCQPNYKKLIESAANDPQLTNLWETDMYRSNELHFLERPEVMQKAIALGIDVETFFEKVIRLRPQVDFLTCYLAGDGFLKMSDIVEKSRELGNSSSAYCYRLLAQTYGLIAPFNKVRETVHEVGIGLCSYLREHPDQKQLLMKSAEFHKALSEHYFRNSMAC